MRILLMGLAGVAAIVSTTAIAAPAKRATTPIIAPPVATAQRVAPTPAAAAELARLYSAPDLTIPAEVRIFRDKFPEMVRQFPDYAELSKLAPTFAQDLTTAVEPSMVRYVERTAAEFQQQSAQVFLDRLSASEVADLIGFYKSAPGKRMLAAMVENANPDLLIDKAMKGEDFTASDATRQIADAARKTGRTMSAADQQAMIGFMRRPGYRGLARISTRLNKLKVDILNAPDPKFEEEMMASMEELMKRYDSATAK